MKEEKTTPLRQRMIEDMHIRGLGEKTQKAHIRNVKHFAAFLGRAPDTATEPPRLYRRVICSTTRRPYRVCSSLHRTPPLLLRG